MHWGLCGETIDLRTISFGQDIGSGSTGGMLPKALVTIGGETWYFKTSHIRRGDGFVGVEAPIELVSSRVLDVLAIPHVEYRLFRAMLMLDGSEAETWVCASHTFLQPGESSMGVETLARMLRDPGESNYDFCCRMGWREQVDQMIAVDFILGNRDRHGANIQIIRDLDGGLRMAPLFDHGLALTGPYDRDFSRLSPGAMPAELQGNNFLGSRSLRDNLGLISTPVVNGAALIPSIGEILADMGDVLPPAHIETIKAMLEERGREYEGFRAGRFSQVGHEER